MATISVTGAVGINQAALGFGVAVNSIIRNATTASKLDTTQLGEQVKIQQLINAFPSSFSQTVRYKGQDVPLDHFISEMCERTGLDKNTASVADLIRACISTGSATEAQILSSLLNTAGEALLNISDERLYSNNFEYLSDYLQFIAEKGRNEEYNEIMKYVTEKGLNPEEIKTLDFIAKISEGYGSGLAYREAENPELANKMKATMSNYSSNILKVEKKAGKKLQDAKETTNIGNLYSSLTNKDNKEIIENAAKALGKSVEDISKMSVEELEQALNEAGKYYEATQLGKVAKRAFLYNKTDVDYQNNLEIRIGDILSVSGDVYKNNNSQEDYDKILMNNSTLNSIIYGLKETRALDAIAEENGVTVEDLVKSLTLEQLYELLDSDPQLVESSAILQQYLPELKKLIDGSYFYNKIIEHTNKSLSDKQIIIDRQNAARAEQAVAEVRIRKDQEVRATIMQLKEEYEKDPSAIARKWTAIVEGEDDASKYDPRVLQEMYELYVDNYNKVIKKLDRQLKRNEYDYIDYLNSMNEKTLGDSIAFNTLTFVDAFTGIVGETAKGSQYVWTELASGALDLIGQDELAKQLYNTEAECMSYEYSDVFCEFMKEWEKNNNIDGVFGDFNKEEWKEELASHTYDKVGSKSAFNKIVGIAGSLLPMFLMPEGAAGVLVGGVSAGGSAASNNFAEQRENGGNYYNNKGDTLANVTAHGAVGAATWAAFGKIGNLGKIGGRIGTGFISKVGATGLEMLGVGALTGAEVEISAGIDAINRGDNIIEAMYEATDEATMSAFTGALMHGGIKLGGKIVSEVKGKTTTSRENELYRKYAEREGKTIEEIKEVKSGKETSEAFDRIAMEETEKIIGKKKFAGKSDVEKLRLRDEYRAGATKKEIIKLADKLSRTELKTSEAEISRRRVDGQKYATEQMSKTDINISKKYEKVESQIKETINKYAKGTISEKELKTNINKTIKEGLEVPEKTSKKTKKAKTLEITSESEGEIKAKANTTEIAFKTGTKGLEYSKLKTVASVLPGTPMTLIQKIFKQKLSTNTLLWNKTMENGLVHLTSEEGVEAIIKTGYVKKSDAITSYGKPASFFFSGEPTFEEVALNLKKPTNKKVGVKIELKSESPESIKALEEFRYRHMDDQALVHYGDFKFKEMGLEAKKAYYVLKEVDGKLKYQEVTKEIFEATPETNIRFKNTKLDNANSAALGMAYETDLIIKNIGAQYEKIKNTSSAIVEGLLKGKDISIGEKAKGIKGKIEGFFESKSVSGEYKTDATSAGNELRRRIEAQNYATEQMAKTDIDRSSYYTKVEEEVKKLIKKYSEGEISYSKFKEKVDNNLYSYNALTGAKQVHLNFKSIIGILNETSSVVEKMFKKNLNSNVTLSNKALDEGILHFAPTEEVVDEIIKSGYIKKSTTLTSMMSNFKGSTHFFAGVPTIEDIAYHIDKASINKLVGVKIKPKTETLGEFKYRYMHDDVLIHEGDFKFSDYGIVPEKAYYVLEVEDGKLCYKEVKKEVYDSTETKISKITQLDVDVQGQADLALSDWKKLLITGGYVALTTGAIGGCISYVDKNKKD